MITLENFQGRLLCRTTTTIKLTTAKYFLGVFTVLDNDVDYTTANVAMNTNLAPYCDSTWRQLEILP